MDFLNLGSDLFPHEHEHFHRRCAATLKFSESSSSETLQKISNSFRCLSWADMGQIIVIASELSELSCSYRLSEFPTKMISSRGMVLM